MDRRFTGSFTQQAQLPEESFAAADLVLRSAALHRYQSDNGGLSETALLERDFAAWQGSSYCLALASGGQAIQLALRAAGVGAGDTVLTNAFTLAPVPGAIRAVGAAPLLVDVTEDLLIDLDDLRVKLASASPRFLLLSHMRGHIPNMSEIMTLADASGVIVIEDCAHTMGATWQGRKSGSFGLFGCFSTQTYKHINSGEGGLLTTNDPEAAARAIILSGSYMNYDRHGAAPEEVFFQNAKYDCPNISARMDNLRAAILRPQLAALDQSIEAWNARAGIVLARLSDLGPGVQVPRPLDGAIRVGSSVQFRLPELTSEECQDAVAALARRGVEVKWFGHAEPKGFTSQHRHWRYMEQHNLPKTDGILSTLFDMRVPLSFSLDDCRLVADILSDVLSAQVRKGQAA